MVCTTNNVTYPSHLQICFDTWEKKSPTSPSIHSQVMVRTKKSIINNSQAIQHSSSIHANDIGSFNYSWGSNYNNGCQGGGLGITPQQEDVQMSDENDQHQLLEYVHRERERKTQKIRDIFNHLTQEEVDVMLMDCGCNEDEVIKRLQTRSDYLEGIQRIVSAVLQPSLSSAVTIKPSDTTHHNNVSFIPTTPIPTSFIPHQQKVQPKLQPKPPKNEQQQPKKEVAKQAVATNESSNHNTLTVAKKPASIQQKSKPTQSKSKSNTQSSSAEDTTMFYKRDSKKRSRMIGRLALDDALKQVKENPTKAYEGWSQARIRAYQMIEQNPNSYYYRFNAPGEEQRKGPWTEEEKRLFFKRLQDVGANGQWGMFSTAIPGRVGYQCSNYYRLLIESGQLQDPNYIVDEKGKAHYLFDKRGSDGRVEKTFRTHNPHTFGNNNNKRLASSSTPLTSNHKKTPNGKNNDNNDGDHSGTFKMNLRSSARIAAKMHTRSKTVP
ncbi:hypothetical protein BDA99DRAFT_523748 [Phascolomyces articulosus]|uniref:Myb-like domain-containing protein n=1 Tax=Phascolomyces articulosus TaxID=60185 RepID=A0AAD5P983_9FUNG|nr:hypothetical protein BDA99DRAFT_523748 [Phascolomyces articulosus]